MKFLTSILLSLALPIQGQMLINPYRFGGGAPPDPLAAIKTNLIAWYDFDDATDAHAAYDWSPIGTPTYSGGYVTILDGTNELTQTEGLSDVFAPAGVETSCTIAMWYEPNATTSNGEDIINGNTARILIEHIASTVGFRGKINQLTADNANSGTPGDNVWYYIVTTYDAATHEVECWVNGASDGPTSVTFSGGAATDIAIEGDGRFASMTFCHRKITSTEIAALYALGKDSDYADLP